MDFDLNDVQLYFEKQVLKIVAKLGKKAVAWHDVLYHRYNISKTEIISHTWFVSCHRIHQSREGLGPEEAIFLGYNFLFSRGFYLDKTYEPCEYWKERFPSVSHKVTIYGCLPYLVEAASATWRGSMRLE